MVVNATFNNISVICGDQFYRCKHTWQIQANKHKQKTKQIQTKKNINKKT